MNSIDLPSSQWTRVQADLARREWPVFDESVEYDAAQAAMWKAEIGDGLPLVVPTAKRLSAMLASVQDVDAMLGHMAPLEGALTPTAIAYNAVIAGCLPAELPLLQAAAIATLEPQLNLLGVQTTTGTTTVAMLVHGPIAAALSMNDASNCLGPGNRANACIGRALHMVLANVGGARPGLTDMATMGQPGKYVFCLAEGAHPALPPLHERRGIAAGQSAVTVLGVSGTLEVLPAREGDAPDTIAVPLAAALRAAWDAEGTGRMDEKAEHMVLVPPELLTRVADAGCDWRAFTARLKTLSGVKGQVHVVCAGGIGEKMTCLQPWGGTCVSVTRRLPAP